jgi:myo-inositol-1(or 4)-monophosphatase
MDLHGILEKVKTLVRHTGVYQLSHFRRLDHGSGDEKAEREFVSHVDLESEELLKNGLAQILPEAGIFGEESDRDRGNHYTWVIDPLDGTTNYLSGLDQWAVSVALLRNDAPLVAVVQKPFSGETFCAIRNMGAYYNNQRLHTVPRLPLRQAVVGTGFPYRSPETKESFFACLEEVLYASRGVRRSGSAALDLCSLAAGFLQGFFETDLEAYDAAAGLLLLEETGCSFTEFSGNPYRLFESRSLVAGFPDVWEELSEICFRRYGDSV